MRELRAQTRFRRDLKRIEKRGLDQALLEAVVDDLLQGRPLPATRRDHPLRGDWLGWRDCHVAPDWLLIYKLTDNELVLARTGSHADLFKA